MKRMATEEIADKRRMLELFTRLENFVESHVPLLAAAEGAGGENPEEELVTTKEAALRTVDAAIQLWSKMLLADAQHDQTIADNITDVQAKGKALLAGLLQQLEQLPALFAHAQRPVVEHCAMTLARARVSLSTNRAGYCSVPYSVRPYANHAVPQAEHEDERMRRQSNGMLHMACRQQLVELRIVFLQWASHSRRRRWARVKDSWVSDRQRHETLASGWAAWQREVLVAQRVAKENALQRLAAVEVERDGLKTALAAEEARLVARETERDSAAISEYERLRVNLRSKETVRRTQLCSRVIKRLLHHHLAVSYRGFAEGVLAARRERETVFRVMLRTSRPAVATKGGLSWALRLWRESTEKVVRLKTACVKVVMRMTCTLMFAGFERWREHTVERQRLQDTARRVIGRWAFASSARGFQLWRDKTTLIRRQRGVIIRVSARLMNRIQAVALSTWRSNTQHQQNLRVTARRIGLRMRHSIVSTALRTWSAATVRTRRHNILVAKALWRLVSARVARAYASWRENTLRIVNTRRVVARAIQRMLDSTVLRSIERWREAVARQVYVRKVMRGMLARSRPRLMEAAFCSWAEFVDGQCNFVDKSLLALENEAEVCLRTFFTDWCHGIFMTRHSRESRVWILGLHVQTSRLRRCVRAWKQHTLAAIWLRARHRELRLSHLRALKARVWRAWHQWLSAERLDSSLNCSGELSVVFARLSRREEIASLRAKEHAKKLLLSDKAAKLAAATSKKASFGLWKHAALRARHQAAGVLRILQRQHLLRVGWTSLVAWMRFTAQSRHRRRGEANLLMRAERRLSAALVAVTWDAWREACGEARRLERIKRVIITRLCLLSAGAAFGTWQHRAAQHRQMRHLMQSVLARMRSAAAAKALLTWRTNAVELRRQAAVGLKVLKRWQHRTATMMFLAWHHLWRHASDLRRVSCRAVARCRRLVVAKAYHTWMRVVQDVVKGRAEEEQKQATMRRVGMSLLRRAERVAFNTWLQHAGLLRHQRGVLQKMTLRIQNITAFKAFCSWHDSVNLMNRCAAITSKVLQRWTNRITAKMFTCWEQRWLDSKRLHYIASKVVRRWMLIELSLAWSVWMENSLEQARILVHARKHARTHARMHAPVHTQVMQRHSLILKNSKTFTCQAKQRSTGKKVVMRWTNRALSKVWSCWKDLAAQRQQQRTLLKKMLHRMTNILLHQSFLTWEGYLTDRQREQCDLDEMRKGREVEELREAAVRHLAERENAEREAKVLTTTLLRDLTRQQQGMKEAQAKAKALDEEVLRLRSQLDGCRCMQGKVTPREREIGESLKMEMFHRCHSTVGLVLRGLEVMEIVPGSPAEQSGQIKAGDMVVSVDGRPVDESTVAALIIGSDLAGTLVDLELRKPRTGVVVHVPLTRASHAIQFSSRHGDHDLKIVVDTVCDPVLRPNSLRREPLQHALDANPPSRSRSRTPTSSADIAPTVNHEPEFVRDGVWRVRVENPSQQHVDEADEALTLPAAGDAVSVDSLSSCVSVGREAGGTLSRMASDSRGVADSSDDGWHFNQEEWRILAALEAEAAAPPPPLPSLVVTNSRVTPPATSRSRHNAVLSALGFETSSQAHMSDIVAPSKAAPAPPRMTTHEQAQFASLRFQPGQHTATSVLPIVGPIPPPPASCRMCSTPVLVHDAAGHGRGGVPAVWREGNTPRAGQGCQDVDARPASGLGVCMFDSDGMPYYSCQECVDICASTSWRTARSAPGFSASSRSISPNNPAVI